MQRVAQDWIVLTQLTRHDATAVGIVTGLQFAPQLLLLPWSGLAADRFNQRKLLMLTQASMGVLAIALGILTISGCVRLWHVYETCGCAANYLDTSATPAPRHPPGEIRRLQLFRFPFANRMQDRLFVSLSDLL